MDRNEEKRVTQLHNHLMSEDYRSEETVRVRNTDRTDVDLDDFARAVEEPAAPKHRGRKLFFVLVLAAVAAYLLWRYV